jgi:hypothetical protein
MSELGLLLGLSDMFWTDSQLGPKILDLTAQIVKQMAKYPLTEKELVTIEGWTRCFLETGIPKALEVGFSTLITLAKYGVTMAIDEGILEFFLKLRTSEGRVLDMLFGFISVLEERDSVVSWLECHGFFTDLLNRVRENPSDDVAPFLFKFMETVAYVPDEIDVLFELTSILLRDGTLKVKTAVLKYLNDIAYEKEENFSVMLAGKGILRSILEVLEAGIPDLVEECIRMMERIVHSLCICEIDFESVEGIGEVAAALDGIIGDFGGIYDRSISQIIETIESESV